MGIWTRITNLRPWSREQQESDLEREIRNHLCLEAKESGEYAARRAFGNSALVKEDVRAEWGWTWIERVRQDLSYASRLLRKSPLFTTVAVLSIALGIGANVAIFSVLDAVLLKSLPVRHPEELRMFTWIRKGDPPYMKSHSGYSISDEHGNPVDGSFSYPAYRVFQTGLPQFSDVVAYAQNQFTVTSAGTFGSGLRTLRLRKLL
jgi:hypothetical protein